MYEQLTSEEKAVIEAARTMARTVASNEHTSRMSAQRGDLDEIHRVIQTLEDRYPLDNDITYLEQMMYRMLY